MKRIAAAVGLVSWLVTTSAHADIVDECISANERSIELRGTGKLFDARIEGAKCAIDTCPEDIRQVCAKRVEHLTALIPSIVFDVRDDAGADLTDVNVYVDGESKPRSASATAISLNPGQHSFVFEVPSQHLRIEKTFVLREGEQHRRERVDIAATQAAPSAGAPPPAVPNPEAEQPPASPSTSSSLKTIGIVTAGIGAAGLVAGGIFALVARSQWEDAKAACGDGCAPDTRAYELKSNSERSASVATVSVVAGGGLVAVGAVLFFVAPAPSSRASANRLAPDVSAHQVGLTWSGRF